MNVDTTYSIYLILISQSILLGAACIALSRFQSRCRDIEKFWESPTGAMLAEDSEEDQSKQHIVSVATERDMIEKLKLDQRVADLQRRLTDVTRQQTHKPQAISFEIERSLPIENALRMAKNGASVEELTRTCGLNVGEARLLQKLHGRDHLQLNQG